MKLHNFNWLICAALLVPMFLFSQSTPLRFNYQAVARNITGQPLANQAISIRFSIKNGSSSGTTVFQETHTATTNAYGLFTLQIGLLWFKIGKLN